MLLYSENRGEQHIETLRLTNIPPLKRGGLVGKWILNVLLWPMAKVPNSYSFNIFIPTNLTSLLNPSVQPCRRMFSYSLIFGWLNNFIHLDCVMFATCDSAFTPSVIKCTTNKHFTCARLIDCPVLVELVTYRIMLSAKQSLFSFSASSFIVSFHFFLIQSFNTHLSCTYCILYSLLSAEG